MKITEDAFDIINDIVAEYPVETGGIIGSSVENIIDKVILDVSVEQATSYCRYIPNISFLNECIEKWQQDNVVFCGVFHTHFFGVQTLSCGDKRYIKDIMESMPTDINNLLFPLFVLPNRELVCYLARKINGEILILADDVEIVKI